MYKLIQRLVFACVLLVSAGAQATTYQYSYLFASGDLVTGYFDGVANGNLIESLTNVSVSFNGVAFDGPIFAYRMEDGPVENYNKSAQASFDGLENSLAFTSNIALDNFQLFLMFNVPTSQGVYKAAVVNSAPFYVDDEKLGAYDGIWTVSAVPEPASFMMLAAGLVLLAGVIRYRARTNKQPLIGA